MAEIIAPSCSCQTYFFLITTTRIHIQHVFATAFLCYELPQIYCAQNNMCYVVFVIFFGRQQIASLLYQQQLCGAEEPVSTVRTANVPPFSHRNQPEAIGTSVRSYQHGGGYSRISRKSAGGRVVPNFTFCNVVVCGRFKLAATTSYGVLYPCGPQFQHACLVAFNVLYVQVPVRRIRLRGNVRMELNQFGFVQESGQNLLFYQITIFFLQKKKIFSVKQTMLKL